MTCISWGRLRGVDLTSPAYPSHSSTLKLTPLQTTHSVACPSSTHTLGGSVRRGCGASNPDSTQHPRRKHGWQMGPDISYQVSAWKIYKVTRQWEADTKSSYLPSTLRGSVPHCTLVLAAVEKIISPLILSIFLSMRYRLGALTQLNHMLVAQQEDIFWCTRGIGSLLLWKGMSGVR